MEAGDVAPLVDCRFSTHYCINHVWEAHTGVLSLKRWMQEDQVFEVTFGYAVSLKPVRDTRDPVSIKTPSHKCPLSVAGGPSPSRKPTDLRRLQRLLPQPWGTGWPLGKPSSCVSCSPRLALPCFPSSVPQDSIPVNLA